MFLGLDCSTQSLKLLVLNEQSEKEVEVAVVYDTDLAHYKTTNGIIRHREDGIDHISTPTLLFVEALELAVSRLRDVFDLSQIKAISGSGQQHGSVWWRFGSNSLLKKLNDRFDGSKRENLLNLLQNTFSKSLSPIWMDSSTTPETVEITQAAGSSQQLANITGESNFYIKIILNLNKLNFHF